jgi:hypothetical protein
MMRFWNSKGAQEMVVNRISSPLAIVAGGAGPCQAFAAEGGGRKA